MNTSSRNILLERLTQLPVLPLHVKQLMEVCQQEDCEIQNVVQILQRDPSLTARVLLVANSPLYGLQRQVSRLGQAVMVLGLEAVRNIALSVTLFQMFRPAKDLALKPEEFWKHSLVVACLSRLIAKQLKFEDPDNAFTAGLLHDFGKIVLMTHFPAEFSRAVINSKKELGLLHEMEQQELGFDHSEVGQLLCEKWSFPNNLAQTITQHHQKLKLTWPAPLEERDLVVVKIANNLSKLIPVGDSGNPFFEKQTLQLCRLVGLEAKDIQKIFSQLPAELSHLGAFFDLKLEDCFQGVSEKSPRVAVINGDLEERAFLNLVLSAMGIKANEYSMNAFEEIKEKAVVVDEDLIPVYEKQVLEMGQVLLRWRDWKNQNPISLLGDAYHISSLRQWMSKELTQQKAQRVVA